jgi:copper chaperone CopZ
MATVKQIFEVEGMHCGSCAMGIQINLENTDGVKSSFVDYNTKKAEVEFDDEKTSTDGIIKAIEELDFKAKIAG